MRETNAFEKHIESLNNETENISVSCGLAYNENGPDVGVRKFVENLNYSDSVIVDNIVWLIAGDVYEKENKTRLSSVRQILNTSTESMIVELRAQSVVMGNIIQVYLGKRKVVGKKQLSEEKVVLDLTI